MTEREMVTLQGIGATLGYALGPVQLIRRGLCGVSERRLDDQAEVEREVARFDAAVEAFGEWLDSLLARMQSVDSEGYSVMEAHRMMLQDELLVGECRQKIERERVNAEAALEKTLKELELAFSRLRESNFREKAADLRAVGEQLSRHLGGEAHSAVAQMARGAIVVAHELSASETAELSLREVSGLVTEVGGATSHVAIMARAMGIPAVVGVKGVASAVVAAQIVALDGERGEVVLNPNADAVKRFNQLTLNHKKQRSELLADARTPAITLDGKTINLEGNLQSLGEVSRLHSLGGTGIGLLRTEYLTLDSISLEDEEGQYESYRSIVEANAPYLTTFRALDLGGDKHDDRLAFDPGCENPALGLRGIRLLMLAQTHLEVQIRAILRASAHGRARLMIPFVTTLDEVLRVKQLVSQAKAELRAEGKPFDETLPFGVMIEVPSAAMIADLLAREVDFFSIGTNDLVQYTLAVDRNNRMVATLYDPLHPAMLRLLARVVEQARLAGIDVSICGELASDPVKVPILIGCGLRTLSMNLYAIPRVKDVVRNCHSQSCEELFHELLRCSTGGEIEALSQSFYKTLPA